MDPQIDKTPGLGLPQPSVEMGSSPFGRAPEGLRMPERATTAETMAPPAGLQPMQPLPPVAAQPQLAAPPVPVPTASDQSTVQTNDDSDVVLDEAWINKAREIVERTHTDPYLQSQELGKIKAQYIKVRYNKDIKVADGS